MSQVLSGLILVQLQKSNPDPFFAVQQKQLADAIAIAVQTYLVSSATVAVVTPTGPGTGKIIAP
jgi:hypothetical protein